MSALLAPSILSFDPLSLGASVATMLDAGAEIVHLDVMDGRFVPPITFGDFLVRPLHRARPDAFLEAHLMIEEPERQFDAFVEAGCRRIIFHAEATAHAHRLAQTLRSAGVEAGLALNPGTPVEAALPLLDQLDLVLVMTVNPGWGGQSFLPAALDKVRRLRAERGDLRIQVDGGIDPTTLPTAREAGADVFVVGSWLVRQPDLADGVRALRGLLA
jgi:ribulose-phosphate 3-epimerase